MFKYLYLFMKERKITQIQMAKEIGMTNTALNRKIRGFTDFTSKEMFTIQKKFFPDKSLEEIFGGAE